LGELAEVKACDEPGGIDPQTNQPRFAALICEALQKRNPMARIAGVDVPNNKQAKIGLTYIFGIGDSRAMKILTKADVDPIAKIGTLDEDALNRIRQVIEVEGGIEGDLRKDISLNIKRLIEIQSYRGLRHRRSLPVRGQRTHTNARTRKGPRKGTVAGKKKVTK
jgi:small subunit ribosomal protein S13